jgi:integrase
MARLRRIPYTKPIPPGADIITRKGKPHARFLDDGRTAIVPLTKRGNRIRLLSRKWYGEYRDADGTLQCDPLSTDKTAAGQMLAELVRKTELKKANIIDPFEAHRKRSLAEHLAEWETSLLASGATRKHVAQTVASARRIIEACRFVFPADLSASRVQHFLADLRERRRNLPPLDPAKLKYTKAELAELLGVTPAAVAALVRRHRLAVTGNGKARRYPLETAEALRSLRTRGRSIKTSNLYLDSVKQFASWLVQDRRMPDNPLAHLSGGNVRLDRRHDRRTLTPEELRSVIQSAGQSEREFRGLSGEDRAMLYSVACVSGFRASELAILCPDAFDFDDQTPTVALAAKDAKNGRTAIQPLPPDVVGVMREYLDGRPADQPIWPGTWADKAAEMFSADLETAGIPYVVAGTDGPLYADFHALRHSFIAMLDRSGATLKEAMQLARHSDPRLTMAVYGRAQLHDLGQAVGRLPSLLSSPQNENEPLAATGTDDKPASAFPPGGVSSLRTACASRDEKCESVRAIDKTNPDGTTRSNNTKPLALQGVESDCKPVIPLDQSSPTRTRTSNKPVNSRLLYH